MPGVADRYVLARSRPFSSSQLASAFPFPSPPLLTLQRDFLLREAKEALENEDFSTAVAIANRMLKEQPHNVQALSVLGQAQRGHGMFEDALATFRRPALSSF